MSGPEEQEKQPYTLTVCGTNAYLPDEEAVL